jgi:hypothetical protein
MPRGDGTGPLGGGPMTGKAAGYCAGYAAPGPESLLPRDEEIALLKSESQRLRSVLETIERRLAQIETA